MGSGQSDGDSVTGIEMLSIFLDGELDKDGCERLLTSAHVDAELGHRLSCYGLIREVIREHDWRQSVYLPSRQTSGSTGIQRRIAKAWHMRRPVWAWGFGGLVACTLAVVLMLGPARDWVRSGSAPAHFLIGADHQSGRDQAVGRYGQVHSVAWNASSSAVRQQLETYWMIHAASLSGSQMMGYPRLAAYNYTVSGRKQGWRHHR